MALHAEWPEPPEPSRLDSATEEAERERAYDDIVAASFPASDPPPGVIKLGPSRSTRAGARNRG